MQTAHKDKKRPSRRVLVIGLDGATFDLIKPWAAAGHLPNLQCILDGGAHASLTSTLPPITGPAWTSFATGTNPGKHRLYDWIARQPDTYQFDPTTALDATAPTLYTLLSEANRRVCVLNVPMTYPAQPVNGVMLSGLPAPDLEANVSYPPSLLSDIVHHTGDYILYPDPGQAYSQSGVDAFLQRLYRSADLRMKAFDYLRTGEAWDFAMMVFNGTDTVSHAMWKYMDQDHPLHDPKLAQKYGSAILDYYRHMDTYIGQVLATLDKNTVLLLMSDHGFGPFHKFIHVNNWLIREQFMQVKDDWQSAVKKRLFNAGFSPMNVYDLLMKLGFGALKRRVVRGQGQGLLKTFFLSFADIDWSRTVAYSLGNVGQICLNVQGREPQGCVPPGQPYEDVRDQIIERLWQLRDPQTGEQVVEAVYRREDIYHGDQLEHAPDIVFMPRRLEYFGFGEYEFGSHRVIEPMRRGISGTHRMNGIFMAYGHGIQPGMTIEDSSLVDLAPTILHILGVDVPSHMDGRILHDIFHDSFQPSAGPVNGVSWQPAHAPSHQLTDEEAETIAKRLRDLGYVG